MSLAERHELLRQAFDELIDAGPETREEHLRTLALRDAELAQELRSLLDADADAAAFLEPPPAAEVERMARIGSPREARFESEEEREELEIDSRLGAYRIVRRIASGGMGAVYLAARADRQFEGFVAIKVLRRALSSPRTAARAKLERQTLASLTHPYIARLLDGGETEDGRPYLVMQYIEGEPIDRWCADRALPIRARLELLERVATAVAHAHRKLIVHRDIKPSNILVSADGSPHLLDFGIARLLSGTDGAGREGATQIAFTPGYASPEQRRGERVGTGADIYSLGRLLLALLPNDLSRGERVELESVVARATAEREEQRYASVEHFNLELERFRRDLPIEAYAGTWAYRTRKFARRHALTLAVAAGGLLGILAAGSALFAAWHSASEDRLRATEARKRADAAVLEAQAAHALADERAVKATRDAARARSAMQLLRRLFQAPTAREHGPHITVAQFLDIARGELATLEGESSEVAAPLHGILGDALTGLGRFDDGIAEYERSLELLRAQSGEDHRAVYGARIDLGEALCMSPRAAEGRALLEETLRALRARPERFADQDLLEVHILRSLARWHQVRSDIGRGLELAREALALCDRIPVRGLLRAECFSLAATLELERDPLSAEALPWIEESLRASEAEVGPDHPSTQGFKLNLAYLSWARGERVQALEIAEQVLAARRKSYTANHPALVAPLVVVGRMKSELGTHDEAIELLREALQIFERAFGEIHEQRRPPHFELALALNRAGEIEEGHALMRQLLARREAQPEKIDTDLFHLLLNVGSLDETQGRYAEALARYQRALSIARSLRGEKHADTAKAWVNVGSMLFFTRDFAGSAEALERAVVVQRELLPPGHRALAHALHLWSRTEFARERYEDAARLLRETVDVLRRSEETHPAALAKTLFDLALAHQLLGDGAGERAALEEVSALARSRGKQGLADLRMALQRLVRWAETHAAEQLAAGFRAELEALSKQD
ncbi:MAG: serine/threonine protein kinase [Planctomycetes bacterium]|nr:serine/threonine protein kinase [Planctomycetota bacterium]